MPKYLQIQSTLDLRDSLVHQKFFSYIEYLLFQKTFIYSLKYINILIEDYQLSWLSYRYGIG